MRSYFFIAILVSQGYLVLAEGVTSNTVKFGFDGLSSTYQYLDKIDMNYAQAEKHCRSIPGPSDCTLASISSKIEHAFIINQLVVIDQLRKLEPRIWIGYTRPDQSAVSKNVWSWANGEPAGYNGWLPGEPHLGFEFCAMMANLNPGNKFRFADVQCDRKFHALICECK